MKDMLMAILVVAVLLAVIFGIYEAYRWINWTFGYSSYVEEYVEPLELKIDSLETRIERLENNE